MLPLDLGFGLFQAMLPVHWLFQASLSKTTYSFSKLLLEVQNEVHGLDDVLDHLDFGDPEEPVVVLLRVRDQKKIKSGSKKN